MIQTSGVTGIWRKGQTYGKRADIWGKRADTQVCPYFNDYAYTAWSQSRRGTEGRQQTRVNATSQALKQSGNTAEDYRGKSGRQQFRRQVGQVVVVD